MPKDVDFNLLKTLQALLEERSVTRAADRLGLSQPAVSASLARLRRHFGDPLLVRVGNANRLSPLAIQLAERTGSALSLTERVFALQPGFQPESARREFTVVMSDYTIQVLGPALTRLLETRAPNARLHLRQATPEATEGAPDSLREIDAFVLPHGFLDDLPYQDLLSDDWVCLVAAGNPAVGAELTVSDLVTLPWVFVFHRPTAFTTAVRELRMHGIEPKVRIVTESYWTLPALIAGSGLITLIQRRLADRLAHQDDLRVLPCPVPLAPLSLAVWWHPVNTADPGHQWLRGLITEAEELSRNA